MKIGFLDRIEYDDLERYSKYGTVKLFNRYTAKKAAECDVVFVTYSRPPDAGNVIVNLSSSDRRHLSHVTNSEIIQAPPWNVHSVARWTLDRIPDEPNVKVAVIGRGKIGSLVLRYLRYRGFDAEGYPHDVKSLPRVDVITLHCPLTEQTRNYFGARIFVTQKRCVVINSARSGLIPPKELIDAVRKKQVVCAYLDGGQDVFKNPRIEVTPHEAWKGERSKALRPFVVENVLKQLSRRFSRV